MKDELIQKLSSDLQITSSKFESDADFYNRLIYSALADWMKICILDRTNERYIDCKSKIYIRKRCEEVLDDFLRVFPECFDYFYKNDESSIHPVSVLRDRMITNQELIEKKEGIYLPEGCINSICPDFKRSLGLPGLDCKSSGITKITKLIDNDKFENSRKVDCTEVYNKHFRHIKWECFEDFSQIEVLDPFSDKPPYQSWKNIQAIMDDNVYLSRIAMNGNAKEYFWVKAANKSILISKVNSSYIQFQEIRRFILWQRKQYGHPIEAVFQNDEKHTFVRIFSRVPNFEQNILDTYGWPIRSIDNKLEYLFLNEMWNGIKELLINLNFKLVEVSNGGIWRPKHS